MKIVIIIFGIAIMLSGVSLIFDPEFLYDWLENNIETKSLYIGAIVGRLVFGIILILFAKESKLPGLFKIFGYLAIIAAIVFIFIGHDGFQSFLSSFFPLFFFVPDSQFQGKRAFL